MGRDDVRNYLIARNIATDENTACTRVAEYFLTGKGAWAQREYFGSPEIQGGLPTPRQKLQAALSGDRLFASEFTFLGKELNGRKAVVSIGFLLCDYELTGTDHGRQTSQSLSDDNRPLDSQPCETGPDYPRL